MPLNSNEALADVSECWEAIKNYRINVLNTIQRILDVKSSLEELPAFSTASPTQNETDFLNDIQDWSTTCENSCPNPPVES